MGYDEWRFNRVFALVVPAQAYVANFLATFKEFPQRPEAGEFYDRPGAGDTTGRPG
jgi:arylsulfatase